MSRPAVRRVIGATAPPVEALWAKLLTIERRLNAGADANGIMRYVGADGNSYALGSAYHALASPPQTVSSTTGQVLTGLQHPVIPGITYYFEGIIRCKQGGTANIAMNIGVSLTNSSSGTWFVSQSDGTNQRWVNAQSINAFFPGGGATGANVENAMLIWGATTTSANDTLAITAKIATVNFSVLAGTFIRVMPT